jgi:hypothetical protein
LVRHMCLVVLLLGSSSVARGQDACAAEVARVCPASRGDVLLLPCLRDHEAEISKACPGDADALLAKAKEIADCDSDVGKLCKGVEAGGGRIVTCLRNNESFLSQSCQGSFNEWRQKRMELQSACSREIGSLCGTVPEGGGRIFTCLKAHEQDLGSDCRSAVKKL